MAGPLDATDRAIEEAAKARALVATIRSKQVRGADHLAMLKSVSYAWFKTHRLDLAGNIADTELAAVDAAYQTVLLSTDKGAAKSTYLGALTRAKQALVSLRSRVLTAGISTANATMDDLAPDFSPLVGGAEMRDVLIRRWEECRKCVAAEAHLAGIVMMGGLLEAMFVARANKMSNKDALIRAVSAPKDKSGNTIDYQYWIGLHPVSLTPA